MYRQLVLQKTSPAKAKLSPAAGRYTDSFTTNTCYQKEVYVPQPVCEACRPQWPPWVRQVGPSPHLTSPHLTSLAVPTQGPLCRFGDTAANAGVLSLTSQLQVTAELPVGVKTAAASAAAVAWRMFLLPLDATKTMMQASGITAEGTCCG
jgi:hypothetical protein